MILALLPELHCILQSLKLSKSFQRVLLFTPVRIAEKEDFSSGSARNSQRVLILLSFSIFPSSHMITLAYVNSYRPIKN